MSEEHDNESNDAADADAANDAAVEADDAAGEVAVAEVAEHDGVEASDNADAADNADSADSVEMSDEPETDVDKPVVTGPPSEQAIAEASMAIEAIVMSSTDPAPSQLLAQMVELPVDVVVHLCHELAASYAAENRGFQLAEVAGGWRYQTNPVCAPYVERFALEGQTARLSGAALETLSIVAYKQPISRAQVSAIRGVNVDGVLRTLVQRGYVDEVARDAGPGQAIMYGTTQLFLERIGLASLKDLPSLGEFVPAASVVEALEQSLRVENEAGYAAETLDGDLDGETKLDAEVVSDEGVSDEAVSDDVEIDLTDEVVDVTEADIDLTADAPDMSDEAEIDLTDDASPTEVADELPGS